jgi:putative heme iron utilization protein
MKKYETLIKDVDYIVRALKEQLSVVKEGNAAEDIFNELKKSLNNITMLPNNIIDSSRYQEHEIVDVLRKIGYEYKKPIGKKLHFFNKKTSISIYLGQDNRRISLQP